MNSKKQVSVLVADGDDLSRDMLAKGMDKYGCIVASVESGGKALKLLDVQQFDVLLLDMNMPDMDGLEVLKDIRKHTKDSAMKVIMMSAQNDVELVNNCKNNGADDYILKPLSLFDMVKRVEQQLGGEVLQAYQQTANMPVKSAVVLIVDDEETNRDILQRRIKKYGYTPVVAEGADEALKLLQDYNVDLILLDIMMPGVDGIQLLATLKEPGKFKSIPVVMLTAQNDKESVSQCIKLGAADYMLKPFDNTKLRARVEFHLSRKS